MKKVPCHNQSCNQRRVHYTLQDTKRPRQMVEVADDYFDKAFCSISCAIEAGYYDVKTGWVDNREKK